LESQLVGSEPVTVRAVQSRGGNGTKRQILSTGFLGKAALTFSFVQA